MLMPELVALPRLVVRPAREDSSVPSSIIIGYDGRETSDDAAALGARLAELTDTKLILVFAYGGEVVAGAGGDGSSLTSPQDDAEAVLQRGLKLVPYGIAAATRRDSLLAGGPRAGGGGRERAGVISS